MLTKCVHLVQVWSVDVQKVMETKTNMNANLVAVFPTRRPPSASPGTCQAKWNGIFPAAMKIQSIGVSLGINKRFVQL